MVRPFESTRIFPRPVFATPTVAERPLVVVGDALTQTRTAVFLADDERQRVDANPGARRLLGIRRGPLVARPTAWLTTDDREQMGIAWAELLACGTFAGRPRLRHRVAAKRPRSSSRPGRTWCLADTP
jgi:PAS domain-containing protein